MSWCFLYGLRDLNGLRPRGGFKVLEGFYGFFKVSTDGFYKALEGLYKALEGPYMGFIRFYKGLIRFRRGWFYDTTQCSQLCGYTLIMSCKVWTGFQMFYNGLRNILLGLISYNALYKALSGYMRPYSVLARLYVLTSYKALGNLGLFRDGWSLEVFMRSYKFRCSGVN